MESQRLGHAEELRDGAGAAHDALTDSDDAGGPANPGVLGALATASARLDQVSELTLIDPYWHQSYTASDRLSPSDLLLLEPYLGRDMTAPRN